MLTLSIDLDRCVLPLSKPGEWNANRLYYRIRKLLLHESKGIEPV
jgi:hypothetical protein